MRQSERANRPRAIGWRRSEGGSDAVPRSGPLLIVLGLAGFVAIWTLYGSISGAGLSLPGDVAEAFVWGQQFQLGYNQHPPLWAWIAGAWFLVLPNRNWAFDLLAVLNSALGLVGCWHLIGRFAWGWERRAAFALLLLTPFYTFLCYKYNANTIFLSVWPWTLYCFLASMASGRSRDALLFGVMLAIAFMSKYYAITLGLTCFLASLVHPARRDWYHSASPWIVVLVCGLLCLPHAIWLLEADAPPVSYMWGLTGIGAVQTIGFVGQFLISVVLFHIVVVGLVLAAGLGDGGLRWRPRLTDGDRVLAVLVLAPALLTALFGLVLELKISSNMTIGAFPLAPLLIMRLLGGAEPRRTFVWARTAVIGITAAALLASPVLADILFFNGDDPDAIEPRQELAQFVTSLWHKEAGTRLRVVAGSDPYENAIGFYSADHPSVFIDFSSYRAPWIDMTRLKHDGLLSVCVHQDVGCAIRAKIYMPPSTRLFHATLSHKFRGYRNPAVSFDFFLVPPAPAGPPLDRPGHASQAVPRRSRPG